MFHRSYVWLRLMLYSGKDAAGAYDLGELDQALFLYFDRNQPPSTVPDLRRNDPSLLLVHPLSPRSPSRTSWGAVVRWSWAKGDRKGASHKQSVTNRINIPIVLLLWPDPPFPGIPNRLISRKKQAFQLSRRKYAFLVLHPFQSCFWSLLDWLIDHQYNPIRASSGMTIFFFTFLVFFFIFCFLFGYRKCILPSQNKPIPTPPNRFHMSQSSPVSVLSFDNCVCRKSVCVCIDEWSIDGFTWAESGGMRPPTLNIFPSQPMHIEPSNNKVLLSLSLPLYMSI